MVGFTDFQYTLKGKDKDKIKIKIIQVIYINLHTIYTNLKALIDDEISID